MNDDIDPTMKARIDGMSREAMAERWRFAPLGDPLFQGKTGDYFKKRFDALGGFPPSISKKIGWDQ